MIYRLCRMVVLFSAAVLVLLFMVYLAARHGQPREVSRWDMVIEAARRGDLKN